MASKPTKKPAIAPVLGPPVHPCDINQVLKWIVSGATEQDILEAVAEKLPGRDPVALINAANAKIKDNVTVDPLIVRAYAFESARGLMEAARTAGDFSSALKAMAYMTKTADEMAVMQEEAEAEAQKAREAKQV